MYTRIALIITGVFLLGASGFNLVAARMADSELIPNAYSLIGLAVMFFSLSYLYPQFIQNDERMKMIREKGIVISYFALIAYFTVFMVILPLGIANLTAIQVTHILFALLAGTVGLSWVVLSKIY